jgi:hypothetical protein
VLWIVVQASVQVLGGHYICEPERRKHGIGDFRVMQGFACMSQDLLSFTANLVAL